MPHNWLRGIDSNYRPSGYEPDELPTAPPRDVLDIIYYTPIFLCCQYFYFIFMPSSILYGIFFKIFL